jgi:hypothetical protein
VEICGDYVEKYLQEIKGQNSKSKFMFHLLRNLIKTKAIKMEALLFIQATYTCTVAVRSETPPQLKSMTAIDANFACSASGILLQGWKPSYLHKAAGVAGESRRRFLRQALIFMCSGEESGVVERTGNVRNCMRLGLLLIFSVVRDFDSRFWYY